MLYIRCKFNLLFFFLDLKPENILLSFDAVTERCIDLKLCDFGLSTKFKVKTLLSDFCGSPGFFAPEMIINGSYFGDKADVWSIGCILLELVLGHEKFCDVWMTAYDYEVLQDKEVFTGTITETVQHLPAHLNFSNDLNSFILQFLQMKPSQRPTVRQLAPHAWLEGMLDEDLVRQKSGRLTNDNRPWSPPPLSPNSSFALDEPIVKEGHIARDVIKEAYGNLSEKERRQMEEYIMHHKDDPNSIHLPPITPATPSIGHAKKILRNGNDVAASSRNFSGDHLANNLSHDFASGAKGTKSPLPTLSEDVHGGIDMNSESITQPTTPQDTRPRLMESQSTNDIPKLHY
jgi:serine/threonine protein kinase